MDTGEFALPTPPALPERLAGRYTLVERLGGGSSAEVWLGRDGLLGRDVAAKVLHRHLLIDASARGRFEQEARAVARLAHPGIVAVYDVAADEIGAVMILERVPGSSLSALLRRHGAIPVREAVRIAAEIAEALAHAHDRGVIHRDLKPGNVLVDDDGRAHLVDFGIARVLDEEAARMTAAGTITGTLMYLAPEQLAGHDVDARADIYGVGLVLFEMLAGEPVYRVTTPVALAEAQQRPPGVIPNTDPVLAGIVRRAIEPDRERRYPTAAALAHDLRAWLWEDDRAAALAGSGAPTLIDPAPPPPLPPPVPVRPPSSAPPYGSPGSVDPNYGGPNYGGPGYGGPAYGGPAYGTIRGGSNVRRPERGRPGWVAPLVLLVAVIVAAVLIAGLAGRIPGIGTASNSPVASPGRTPTATPKSPSPSPSASASPTPSPTASPSPSPSPTAPVAFTEAMARLRDLIREGQDSLAIGVRAGDELLVDTREIVKGVNEDRPPGQIRKLINDFRKKIDDMVTEERIRDPAFADRLRQSVDEVEATFRG